SMKHSFAVGIGLFLAFIGLYLTGIVRSPAEGMTLSTPGVVPRPPTPVGLGHLGETHVLLSIGGFLLIVILVCGNVRGAIVVGIVATAAVGIALGQGTAPDGIVAFPFTGEYNLGPIAFQLKIAEVFQVSFLPILLTLFLMGFLDTLGTLVGVGAA